MQSDTRETQAPNVPTTAKVADESAAKKSANGHSMNVRASDADRGKAEKGGTVFESVVEKVKAAENVLVALSNDPNVDEMAAAIGLSILLESLGKHATAIYSGKTPNVLEFLKPEETFETNTNGLQDFIIELDKEKADHLRYKVDGDFVKVYITPYRTTLSQGDLAFSRGDFNVDLVISLNVAAATELDAALREYGRIMHDATAVNITNGVPGKFGDVEWVDPKASSVSEMVAELAVALKEDLDQSVATALLTGIAAATDKFGNEATTPEVMMLAAKLMKSGANQQEVFKNISQELEYVEREVAEAEVDSAAEGLRRETETMGGSDGELKVEGDAENTENVETVENVGDAGDAETKAAETPSAEVPPSAEVQAEAETVAGTEEMPKEEVIVTPTEGPEKAEGESLADQILSKIKNQGAQGVQNDSQGAQSPDYGQMIDQVSAEPMPGENMVGANVGDGAMVEAPSVDGAPVTMQVTMQPNVATPVDSAQEEAAAMDVIRQASANPAFPEGMELPSVIPGGGSSVNPAMSTVTSENPAAGMAPVVAPETTPVADVPAMDLQPVGMTETAGGGLPMPGQELGTPPVPPMPDFSTMPATMPSMMGANTMSEASADVPAGAQAMSPAGVPMGAMPGEPVVAPSSPSMADPGSFQIPPVAF